MSFNWNDFLDFANGLIKAPGQFKEASLRSAVSRAYYAGYHLASEYAIENHDYSPYKLDSHNQLKEHFRKKNIKVSQHLERLHQWRKQCDYNPTVDNLESQMVPSVVNKVYNLISLLN